jgi:pimeloyl-ACP methyl ester carboxylesterase
VLAERFTVIAPDLRGYGDTEKPHTGYDKRTMANDVIALMDHLGHERIALIGHDRGARVGTRFAKDHRARIDRFVAMDNIPTRVIAETYDANLARQGYRFFTFLGVPDLPEALIAGREEIWLTHFYRSWSYTRTCSLRRRSQSMCAPTSSRGQCGDLAWTTVRRPRTSPRTARTPTNSSTARC